MTQHQKILTLMAADKTGKWFYPYDFMPPRLDMSHPCFVGYEATARMAELRGKYRHMIETTPDGKYKRSRISWATSEIWFDGLPIDVQKIIAPHRPSKPFQEGMNFTGVYAQ